MGFGYFSPAAIGIGVAAIVMLVSHAFHPQKVLQNTLAGGSDGE
jgi:hypothetical protein